MSDDFHHRLLGVRQERRRHPCASSDFEFPDSLVRLMLRTPAALTSTGYACVPYAR